MDSEPKKGMFVRSKPNDEKRADGIIAGKELRHLVKPGVTP